MFLSESSQLIENNFVRSTSERKYGSAYRCTCRRNITWIMLKTIDWMEVYATANIISVISLRQLTLFMSFSRVSPVLGWGSEPLCQLKLPRKTQRIQCGSNSGPQDYVSDTLPLSHAGSQKMWTTAYQSVRTLTPIKQYQPFLPYIRVLARKKEKKL